MSSADQLDLLLRMERIRAALAGGDGGQREAELLGDLGKQASELGPPSDQRESARVAGPRKDTLGDDDDGVSLLATPTTSHLPLGALNGLARTGWSLLELRVERERGGSRPQRLCVRYQVPGYSAEAARTLALAKEPVALALLPTFYRERVAELDTPVEALLRVEVERMGKQPELLYLQTFAFWLLPMTTAVVWMAGSERADLRDNLACWVTPSASEVLAALRGAVEHTPDQQFTGYSDIGPTGVARRVRDQVAAIFEYLKQRGMTYITSDLAIAGPGTIVQRVRSPAESLTGATPAANCIDGVVLYASLLLAVGIEPAIVLLPGHSVLGWRRVPGATDWTFLETIATRKFSFAEACEQGAAAVQRAGSAVKIVDVKQMRDRGLYPSF